VAAAPARGLIAVWLHVPPEREEEFNDWYELEHLAHVTNLPGFTGARRYCADDAIPKYLAWYETDDERVEPGPAFQHIVKHPTGWSRRIRTFYGDHRIRHNCRLAWSHGMEPAADAPFLYTVQTDCGDPARAAEFWAWYDGEHLPALAAVPGVLRTRRYEAVTGSPRSLAAYELAAREVFESPAWLAAREASRTDKMKPLFANARRVMYRLIRGTLHHGER
jgi:hypothetical protein